MKVEFKKNPRAIDVINPYVTLEEWKAMTRGNFTITPNTIFSHFFTTAVGGALGYKFTNLLISRGVPIGPMESWKVLKSAHLYRTLSTPVRYGRYAASSAAPVLGVASAVELSKTKTGNIGMRSIPSSGGGYSNPMGGSDETYYPFKGVIDAIFG